MVVRAPQRQGAGPTCTEGVDGGLLLLKGFPWAVPPRALSGSFPGPSLSCSEATRQQSRPQTWGRGDQSVGSFVGLAALLNKTLHLS